MSNNDTFQWTDELVVQCFEYIREDTAGVLTPVGVRKNVEYFKASHTQQEPEKVEANVSGARWQDNKAGMLIVSLGEVFISEDKFPSIKEAIEKVLNEQPLQQEPNRDWEIVEYWNAEGFHKPNSVCKTNGCKITSVRRLSDGEVFTVGDEVRIVSKAVFGWDRNPIHRIKYFALEDGGQLFIPCETDIPVCGNNLQSDAYKSGIFYIDDIAKLPAAPPKPQVLFTTEDGVQIHQGYEGKIWRVFIKPHSFEMWKPYEIGMPQYINSAEEKYFSTEATAKEFCIMNKPCLSVNDILALWPLSPEPKNAITDLAKFKQKQPTT